MTWVEGRADGRRGQAYRLGFDSHGPRAYVGPFGHGWEAKVWDARGGIVGWRSFLLLDMALGWARSVVDGR